jgi:hypothetical protein
MFNLIKRLFSRKKQIKKFSSTLTSATEGSNSKHELNPEIKEIFDKLKTNKGISNEHLNKVSEFYFQTPEIEPGLYNLSKTLADTMCFDISNVNAVFNKAGDIEDIFINLREVSHNLDMVITVSVKDFHEALTLLKLKPIEIKE